MAYNVSNNWNTKVSNENNLKYVSYLLINNNYIPMQQISKIEFIEEVIDKEKEYFNLGTFNSNQMDITFRTLENLNVASNLPVYCEIGLNTDYKAIDFTYIGLDTNGYKQFTINNSEDLQYFKEHYYVNVSVNNVKYEQIEILDITNNTFTLDLYQASEIQTTDTIVIYPFEYAPKGHFLIDIPEENYHKTCKISCLDYGIKFKTPVDYSVAFTDGKITLKNLLIWLCNHYGVTLGTYPNVNNNIEIGVYDNTLSGKAYVSYIAEMFGGNVKIDRNGVLNIIPLKQNAVKTINALKTKKFELGEKFKISKVVYQDAIRYFDPGNDTANTLYIRPENMFVSDRTAIENIYNAIKDFEIYSLSNELKSDVSIDCWDIVNYQVNENTYPTYYNNKTTYNMSLMTKVETKIPSKQQEQTTNVVGGNEEAKLSIVKTTLDLVKKQIELLVENIGEDGEVTAATIMLAINDDTSSIKLDADKIDIDADDILTLIANNQINLSTKNITIASNNFSVSAIGEIMAKLGKIGGWTISDSQLYSPTSNNKITGMASSDWPGDPVFFAGGGNPYNTPNWATSVPFYVTNEGYFKSTSGKIGGFNITDNTLYAQNYAKNDYTTSDRDLLQAYLLGQASLTDEQKVYLDANSDGTLDTIDLQIIQKMLIYNVTTLKPVTISMNNGINGLNSAYTITDGNGTERLKLSIDGVRTPGSVSCNYINAGNIDCGTCILKSSSTTWVPFNKTFNSVPKVVITPNTSASGAISPKISGIYTTGFDAIIGGSGFSNIDCDWIAISN